jgi:HPt (histidine-containing phosphotransfer) domain-containing protein
MSVYREPFEIRYLNALSKEGVDLQSFLGSWRQAMEDDLARLGVLRRDGQLLQARSVLHRLSGSVGLVGARNLADALQRASRLLSEHNVDSADALISRVQSLVAQLEVPPQPCRSASR